MTKYVLIETDDNYAALRIQDYIDMMCDDMDASIWNSYDRSLDSYVGHVVLGAKKHK